MDARKRGDVQHLKAFLAHVFIVLTGLAALPHSVWSFSIIFNGREPAFGPAWFGWIFAGAMLGIAVDAGQIVISIQIARGERTVARYIAFGVLTLATFYLQWLFASAHVSHIGIGEGVNQNAVPFVGGLQDAGMWIIPAMLPIATLIYTFGYSPVRRARGTISASKPQNAIIVEKPAENMQVLTAGKSFAVQCPDCDWSNSYHSERSASNALNAHKRWNHSVVGAMSANGHRKE